MDNYQLPLSLRLDLAVSVLGDRMPPALHMSKNSMNVESGGIQEGFLHLKVSLTLETASLHHCTEFSSLRPVWMLWIETTSWRLGSCWPSVYCSFLCAFMVAVLPPAVSPSLGVSFLSSASAPRAASNSAGPQRRRHPPAAASNSFQQRPPPCRFPTPDPSSSLSMIRQVHQGL